MLEIIRNENDDKFDAFGVEALTAKEIDDAVEDGTLRSTLFAGGCFWGLDSYFGSLDGVIQTRVGYAGSPLDEPTYGELKGHAETVRIYFDPRIITYRELLQEFASKYYNGRSVGQYRMIFFTDNDREKYEVEKVIKNLISDNDSYPEVIDTDDEKGYFWSAEEHHQKYRLQRNKLFLPFVKQELGERWDEHSFATKLNASSETDFDITPWVETFSDKAKRIFLIN
jgi:peptide-methionine (S)-S-oxide reductase